MGAACLPRISGPATSMCTDGTTWRPGADPLGSTSGSLDASLLNSATPSSAREESPMHRDRHSAIPDRPTARSRSGQTSGGWQTGCPTPGAGSAGSGRVRPRSGASGEVVVSRIKVVRADLVQPGEIQSLGKSQDPTAQLQLAQRGLSNAEPGGGLPLTQAGRDAGFCQTATQTPCELVAALEGFATCPRHRHIVETTCGPGNTYLGLGGRKRCVGGSAPASGRGARTWAQASLSWRSGSAGPSAASRCLRQEAWNRARSSSSNSAPYSASNRG